MYLKNIEINNYRNFQNVSIALEEGLNVIIGANNNGKSNLLTLINLLSGNAKLDVDDINKNYLANKYSDHLINAPSICIKYKIEHQLNFAKPDSAFQKLEHFLIYNELAEVEVSGEIATLSAIIELKYEIDPTVEVKYKEIMENVDTFEKFMENLLFFNNEYRLSFYNIENNQKIDSKFVFSIFEIENIQAARETADLERVSKRYVKEQISEIDTTELTKKIREEITETFGDISEEINEQIKKDQIEIGIVNGKNEFLSKFNFSGEFSENFMYFLKNIEYNYELTIDRNGLGYNNLIYMSNKIKQKKDNDYNILLIEEPEAHLHPNMQYQLMNFIEKLKSIEDKGINNQIIITTHSPNISATTDFKNMIIFNYEKSGEEIKDVKTIRFSDLFDYRKVKSHLNIPNNIDETQIDVISNRLFSYRNHLGKFLDITRSDILFSHKVILVEGISEKLTIPIFAKILGIDLVTQHIVIQELGGITFNNFLPLFLGQNKKALCFSDCDFKYILTDGKNNILNDFSTYNNFVRDKEENFFSEEFKDNESFRLFTQRNGGSTFEPELILENFDIQQNFNFLVDLVNIPKQESDSEDLSSYIKSKSIVSLYNNLENIKPAGTMKKVKKIIVLYWDKYNELQTSAEKIHIEKMFFTHLLYSYIKGSKGDFALNLCISLSDLKLVEERQLQIDNLVPTYIKEGLTWLLT